MENKQHYFYVLKCSDQSYYAGYTIDLTRRLQEHNTGRGAKYTHPKARRPVEMIHAESFTSRSEAMKAEAAFKKLTRIKKEHYLNTQKDRSIL